MSVVKIPTALQQKTYPSLDKSNDVLEIGIIHSSNQKLKIYDLDILFNSLCEKILKPSTEDKRQNSKEKFFEMCAINGTLIDDILIVHEDEEIISPSLPITGNHQENIETFSREGETIYREKDTSDHQWELQKEEVSIRIMRELLGSTDDHGY